MEHFAGYDEWKARVPDVPSGGVRDSAAYSHTRMLWFRAYRFAKRHGVEQAWLDEQRQVPAFEPFVREVDGYEQRHRTQRAGPRESDSDRHA